MELGHGRFLLGDSTIRNSLCGHDPDLLLGTLAGLALFNCSEQRSGSRKDTTRPHGNWQTQTRVSARGGAKIARAMSRSLARILVTADYRVGADLFGTVFEYSVWVSRFVNSY
jgi:hypothetical protein